MAETSGHAAGVPPRADARRNRARVLEAAQKAFAAEGLAVPLDEIARRAGVGAGTVYRHFPSKDALFEAVILDRLEQLVDDACALADADDPGEAFFTVFASAVGRASLNRALCEALAAGPGLSFKAAPDVRGRYLEALEVLLARAQKAGAVRTDVDVADVRDLMVGCMAMEQQHGGSPGRVTAIVCDGLRPGRPRDRAGLPAVTKAASDDSERNETQRVPAGRETSAGPAGPAGAGPADEGPADEDPADDGQADEGVPGCEVCGAPIQAARTGRRPRFCGAACRQKAHRRRARAGSDASARS
jgi:AcrR family transcriptional regulator